MTSRRRPGRPVGGGRLVERDEMLDAAERALRREGASVSMDVIAAEAGVTKPVLYDRVGGRAALADALAERLAGSIVVAGGRVLQGRDTMGRAEFTEVCTAVLDTLAEHRQVFCYLLQVGSDDVVARTVALVGRSADPLTGLLARFGPRDVDPERRRTWAHAIVGMLNVVGLWWISSPERSSREIAEDIVELIWAAVSSQSRVP